MSREERAFYLLMLDALTGFPVVTARTVYGFAGTSASSG